MAAFIVSGRDGGFQPIRKPVPCRIILKQAFFGHRKQTRTPEIKLGKPDTGTGEFFGAEP